MDESIDPAPPQGAHRPLEQAIAVQVRAHRLAAGLSVADMALRVGIFRKCVTSCLSWGQTQHLMGSATLASGVGGEMIGASYRSSPQLHGG